MVLMLLSPAKSMSFTSPLSSVLAAASTSAPLLAERAGPLLEVVRGLSKPELKKLMSLSDSLAALNHGRYANFTAQPERCALGAFEGQAYKGLDAPSLGSAGLAYLQRSLRILCGLYGILRPTDRIRPYRLEMSTRLKVGDAPNLYAYWGSALTDAINEELDATPDGAGKFVLNIASQEYAKAVSLDALRARVVTARFPGPAVHAKMARGEMARYCATTALSSPEQLRAFTGSTGQWAFVPAESSEDEFVFKRGGGGGGGGGAATAKMAGAKRARS